MLGNPGHPVADRRLPHEELEDEPPNLSEWRPALPSTCVRRLSSPRPADCDPTCDGRQPDGGCLCDIVRAATAAGVEWSFEIDKDQYWVYIGPVLPEAEAA